MSSSFNFPTRNDNFSISPAAAAGLLDVSRMTGDDDWNLVLRFLHWDGTFYSLLTNQEHGAVRFLADGFGDLSSGVFPAGSVSTMLWDWSHVRDSSDEGLARMASWIRAWVAHYTR